MDNRRVNREYSTHSNNNVYLLSFKNKKKQNEQQIFSILSTSSNERLSDGREANEQDISALKEFPYKFMDS